MKNRTGYCRVPSQGGHFFLANSPLQHPFQRQKKDNTKQTNASQLEKYLPDKQKRCVNRLPIHKDHAAWYSSVRYNTATVSFSSVHKTPPPLCKLCIPTSYLILPARTKQRRTPAGSGLSTTLPHGVWRSVVHSVVLFHNEQSYYRFLSFRYSFHLGGILAGVHS